MTARGRDVDRPMACTGHVRLAPLLDAWKRPALSRRGVVRTITGANKFLELVVESLGTEVAFFLRHPFLKTKMRFDLECRHERARRFSDVSETLFTNQGDLKVADVGD